MDAKLIDKLFKDEELVKRKTQYEDHYVEDSDAELGSGSFGTVIKGYTKKEFKGMKPGRAIAIKKVDAKGLLQYDLVDALNEVIIWGKISEKKSPFVLELLDWFVLKVEDDADSLYCLHMVTPLGNNTLKEIISYYGIDRGGLSESFSTWLAVQLLFALLHLHESGIVSSGE